jgi:hypothetical protein
MGRELRFGTELDASFSRRRATAIAAVTSTMAADDITDTVDEKYVRAMLARALSNRSILYP